MKKSIVFAILGTAAVGLTVCYGQGTVNFQNYYSTTSPVVSYSTNPLLVTSGKAGLAVGSGFDAELAWGAGVVTDPSLLTMEASSLTPFGADPIANPAADGQLSYGAGWFLGPNVTLGSAAGNTVTLEVFAFNNGSLAASTVNGHSSLFQVTLGGGALPPASLNGTAGQSFVVTQVPEPTTLALGGLGLAALMLFRRKQA